MIHYACPSSPDRSGRSVNDGPQSHLSKAGTPTMGGALILISTIAVSTLLWADLTQPLCLDRAGT